MLLMVDVRHLKQHFQNLLPLKVASILYYPDFKDSGINDMTGDGELMSDFARRNSGKAEMVVPERWRGIKVYVYAFAFD